LFSIDFLHVIREFELARAVSHFRAGARVLEIGGGTGYQARRLSEMGFDVSAVDIAGSVYADDLVFPVQIYDGAELPFPDQSFDIVFSSNVLEHVRDPATMHREVRRVLRTGGYCVHVVPTGAWRLWTNVAHYVEMLQRLALAVPDLIPRGIGRVECRRWISAAWGLIRTLKGYVIVRRHGERGNALSEIFWFSSLHWDRQLHGFGFDVVEQVPVGLFYTGHMILGSRLSLQTRQQLARFLGSACVLFRLAPSAAFHGGQSELRSVKT